MRIRWPWSRWFRKGRHVLGQPERVPDLTNEARRAQDANDRAEDALRRTIAKGQEVNRVSASLQQLRARNQFAEMMLESFKGNT